MAFLMFKIYPKEEQECKDDPTVKTSASVENYLTFKTTDYNYY